MTITERGIWCEDLGHRWRHSPRVDDSRLDVPRTGRCLQNGSRAVLSAAIELTSEEVHDVLHRLSL